MRKFGSVSVALTVSGILTTVTGSAQANNGSIWEQVEVYQGQWNTSTWYNAGNLVSYNGALYQALSTNLDQSPASKPQYWVMMAGGVGPAGPQGPQGTPGVAGAAGKTGAAGPAGPVGPAGSPGAIGPAGPKGATGSPGPAGANGAVGSAGPQGPAGPQGAQGIPGPVGPQGPAGASGKGLTYIGLWNATNPYQTSNVVTENGTSYVALANNTDVDPNQDVTNSSGNWAIIAAAAAGATGAPGSPGAPGAQGLPGIPGPVGPAGPIGPSGSPGAIGPAGPQGIPGAQGSPGLPGAPGALGPVGPQGTPGPAGPPGSAGASGSGHDVVVRDSNGAVVGVANRDGAVVFEIGGRFYSAPATSQGFAPFTTDPSTDPFHQFSSYYTEPDCAGTPYWFGASLAYVVQSLQVIGTTGYYYMPTSGTINFVSYIPGGNGNCFNFPSGQTEQVATSLGQVDLSGFAPPFSLAWE